jgi:hypothetical protein
MSTMKDSTQILSATFGLSLRSTLTDVSEQATQLVLIATAHPSLSRLRKMNFLLHNQHLHIFTCNIMGIQQKDMLWRGKSLQM